jgi:hypothetical protein
MSFTDLLEDRVLTHFFTADAAPTRPTAWYVGLLTAAPTDSTVTPSEISAGNYARVGSVALSVSGTSPTVAENDNTIAFSAASIDWGTVSHIGIFDASTGGNLLAYTALTDPNDATQTVTKTVNSGDIFQIAQGNLQIRID